MQRCTNLAVLPGPLQRYVEQADYTVQLHRIFLDDSGQQKQGLTARDKEQVGPALPAHPWLAKGGDACLAAEEAVREAHG